MKKVYIDIGHGGADGGACYGRFIEKNMNLTRGLALGKYLEGHGVEVKYCRTTDVYVTLEARAQDANAWGADICISVHFNAGRGDGYEEYHSIYGGTDLATCMARRLAQAGQNPHGVGIMSKAGQHGDYYFMNRCTNMTTIISEAAYIDSNDVAIADTDPEIVKLGEAEAMGILDYFGISAAPVVEVPLYSVLADSKCVTTLSDKNAAINFANQLIDEHRYMTCQVKDQHGTVIFTRSQQAPVNVINRNTLAVQKVLNRLHIKDMHNKPLAEDGDQGPCTTYAIKQFQTIMNLEVDGSAGPLTWNALNEILAKPVCGTKFPGHPYAVRYIQWRLGCGTDGSFGPLTTKAAITWQSVNGLMTDGNIGPESWKNLIG